MDSVKDCWIFPQSAESETKSIIQSIKKQVTPAIRTCPTRDCPQDRQDLLDRGLQFAMYIFKARQMSRLTEPIKTTVAPLPGCPPNPEDPDTIFME